MTGRPGRVPDGVVGAACCDVALRSAWDRPRGRGCELTVTLSSGLTLWVICTGIVTSDETLTEWRQRAGRRIAKAVSIVEWPLAGGGHQTTLDVVLEDGFRFEGDLIVAAAPDPDVRPETEWVFEGTPGVEMGRSMDAPR